MPQDLTRLESALAANPRDLATAATLADGYATRGNHARAAALLRAIAQASPRSLDVQLHWAQEAGRLGHPQEIVDACRAALALKPDLYRLHYQLGRALETANDKSAALSEYRAALRLAPNFQAAQRAFNNLNLMN